MSAYINGIGLISPQKTAETGEFLTEIVESEGEFLKCVEPVYKTYIDPIAGRRMSRLIKMGISAAKMCVADSGNVVPDAIITGTGLGSVEDTEKILSTMREDEKFFNPTPFIQSTYNTISSQIAISLKCHGYNSTYVHRIFSFESGLQDAMMHIEEGSAANVLTGGVDEMTLNHLQITRRAGHWKMEPIGNMQILNSGTPGALAGEGSAWFMISSERGSNTYAQIESVETWYDPDQNNEAAEKFLERFLENSGLKIQDVDLILMGNNGDSRFDRVYDDLVQKLGIPAGYYKHLCGEYHTSSGFALWLASNIIRRGEIPSVIKLNNQENKQVKNIVIFNHYRKTNFSAILVKALS